MRNEMRNRKKSVAESGYKKRKRCPFAAAGFKDVDYKDVETLEQFITERGKILPRRITGV